ncbi:MAG TPA: type II toxin-antitoxin system RelE/ParE family toxin [Nitrospiraceae bacterium]|nr:type II toxin-antitoxin system RelE/ParE family toxin [Nitrospiraceae bacterium]
MIGNLCRASELESRKSGYEMNAERIESSYVAKFEEAVYVLHVFQKRSQKTAQPDLDLGKSRYADLLKWRREEGQ